MPREVFLPAFVPRGAISWLATQPHRRHLAVDASLVRVDLSGFTALSERLAHQGRVGSEEVTNILNTVFSSLLAVAYEDDASLLKFGGDALLLQFADAGHSARACRAAIRMQQRLRILNPLTSSVGPTELQMTAGVHSGRLDLFLVGSDTHRDLILAGPGASAVVQAEAAAAPGEVLVSGATAPLLPPDLVERGRDGSTRLIGAPHAGPFATANPKGVDAEPAIEALLPGAVRERILEGVHESEHRPAVVAFVRFGGTDLLLQEAGPVAVAAALDELVTAIQDAANTFGVSYLASDVDADGGKIVLVAGVPRAAEFDGEQMLRAVLDVVRTTSRLPLQVGVHRGPVFTGVIGPPFRLTYTIIGDAVNLAARVMSHAVPGQVLATAPALNHSQVLFEVEEVDPFRVKGKSEAVTAWSVGDVTARRIRPRERLLPLVGRDGELGQLVAVLDTATTGEGRLALVIGPAGFGKSRLVEELQERRPEIPFILAAAHRYERHTPYHVIAILVRRFLGIGDERPTPAQVVQAVHRRAARLVDWAPLLGDVLGVAIEDSAVTAELSPTFRAERIMDVVGQLFAEGRDQPSVLVLENVHWFDDESLLVLAHLVKVELPHRPWLVLATAREPPDLPEVRAAATLMLDELAPADVRTLALSGAAQGMIPLEAVERIVDRSSGNPLFLEELLASDESELPDSLETLVQSRIDRLDGDDRYRLRYAAVLGVDVDLELFTGVVGSDVTDDTAAWKRLDAFLEPVGHGRVRFRHALVHEAAYATLPYSRRRDLHERAGHLLERRHEGREEEAAELLAIHFFNARRWEKAWRYSRMAGDRAHGRHANPTAAVHYRRAIEAGRYDKSLDKNQIAATWERLGDALMLASTYDDAVAAYRRAKRLATPEQQVHLCSQIGQLRERQGRYREALTWFTRGSRLDDSIGSGERARMLVESAIVRIRQGKPRVALTLAERAASLARPGDVQVQARVSYARAWAAMLLGEDAEQERKRTLELFEEADDLIGQGLAYNIISMAAYYRGDWDEAAAAYDQARTLRRRVGDEVASAVATGNLGELLADQGHFDRAEPMLEEARAVCSAAGYPAGQYFAIMSLGRLRARQGRYEEAGELLVDALEHFRDIEATSMVWDAHVRLAELALFRGDHATALAEAEEVSRATDLGTASMRLAGERFRICVLMQQGQARKARVEATHLLDQLGDAEDYDAALALVAIATALEAGEQREAVRSRAQRILDGLGVVIPAEQLVLGPIDAATQPRPTRPGSTR